MIGNSPAMRQLLSEIERLAPLRSTVLIEGESGTGKQLVASALHEKSFRAQGPFVQVRYGIRLSRRPSRVLADTHRNDPVSHRKAASRCQQLFQRPPEFGQRHQFRKFHPSRGPRRIIHKSLLLWPSIYAHDCKNKSEQGEPLKNFGHFLLESKPRARQAVRIGSCNAESANCASKLRPVVRSKRSGLVPTVGYCSRRIRYCR